MSHDFGAFEKVDVKKAWSHEQYEFTPWLATEENIELLGRALGLERYFQILWMSSDQAASFFSPSVNVTLAITSWISSCWLSLRQVFEAESANL